jgi:hypothetical protein
MKVEATAMDAANGVNQLLTTHMKARADVYQALRKISPITP